MASAPRKKADRPLRRDAQRNRERLLAAAVTALLRDGHGVSMAKIAEEAGVGVGTLYRRYPSREHLLEDLQRRSYQMVVDMLREVGAADCDGQECIRMFLTRTVEHGSQLVMTWHGAPPTRDPETLRLETELHDRVAAMVKKGILDGSVRPGVTALDVVVFGAMIAQPFPTAEPMWPELTQRQIANFLRGLAPR